ncbi:MAG TPA: hypothetical protein VGS16_13655 [Candidatus Dormibacteraeota bacterium]|nr:hypothetical protein [Candidatus Dormibacteraeota bacterium]
MLELGPRVSLGLRSLGSYQTVQLRTLKKLGVRAFVTDGGDASVTEEDAEPTGAVIEFSRLLLVASLPIMVSFLLNPGHEPRYGFFWNVEAFNSLMDKGNVFRHGHGENS